ncbi:MAG: hypothetical protein KC586_02310, partial [Myxococcales bacterium]|nr:hypothetical protein [Myxococcales bacterium]
MHERRTRSAATTAAPTTTAATLAFARSLTRSAALTRNLIGHGAMVRTLANAFESGRIAQAWMLT